MKDFNYTVEDVKNSFKAYEDMMIEGVSKKVGNERKIQVISLTIFSFLLGLFIGYLVR